MIARPIRLSLLAALAALGLAGACATPAETLARADGNYRDRDFERALRKYREVRTEACAPRGDRRLCCPAMIGEGQALIELQERHAGLAALERARSECPYDLEVRRKLYLANHASDPESNAQTSSVAFIVDNQIGKLSERARIAWLGIFLDGEVVGREPSNLAPGEHELEGEAMIEARDGGRTTPVRLSARTSVHVPGGRDAAPHWQSTIRIVLGERPGASLPEDRMTFQMEATPLAAPGSTPATPPAAPAGAPQLSPALSQHLGLELRVSGNAPRVPPELLRRGEGWKMRSEICVAPDGHVDAIKFLEPSPAHDPRVDAAVLEALRRWRYGGYRVNGVLQGFCHPLAVDLAR
jgi:hypothetical protein